jgi:hypothetical protein
VQRQKRVEVGLDPVSEQMQPEHGAPRVGLAALEAIASRTSS